MQNPLRWTSLLLVVALVGCAQTEPMRVEVAGPPPAAADAEISLGMPISTTSTEARRAFADGLTALDMQRPFEAERLFRRAVEADPDFALGYLYLANASNSTAEFTTNMEHAEARAPSAPEAERLMIRVMRQQLDNDAEGALATARELTTLLPESPRAWMLLADAQGDLNQHAAARTSLGRAIGAAPDMPAAHLTLANSFLFGEPRDPAKAAEHARHAIALAPDDPTPHDILGDALRAQGKLEKARDAYTEAAERSGDDGSPYQQRGHVNSFLGDFEAARADYDRAISMAKGNAPASFAVYRAYVPVHAGDPAAAIEELRELAERIDGMGIPEPTGLKLFALGSATQIALHHDMFETARRLIDQWTPLVRQQIAQVDEDAFRRAREADIAYVEGLLAARMGDYDAALARADEMARLVEPDANPRKMEGVHALQGFVALERGQHAEAARHLKQAGHATNIYVRYHLAQALEGAGEGDEAMRLYGEVAGWHFNGVGAALTHREAKAKIDM